MPEFEVVSAANAGPADARASEDRGGDGWEADLWRTADALRGAMDAAEYKHVVLGLIFLKYISDAFGEHRARIETAGGDPEDMDEYRGAGVFWAPRGARWEHLRGLARQPDVGRRLDEAMAAVERDNPALRDTLPKEYARPALDPQRLGRLIDLVGNIAVGDAAARSRDMLGRVYEYFLSRFASAEGKRGGEFYTPACVVRLLVEMLRPWQGRVYDPCCGSAGMFVQSAAFVAAHASVNGNGGRARGDIAIYGQESNHTTWRLARMNLAIRGIDAAIAHGDSFHDDRHPDLKADYILANPHFNDSDWGGERLREDVRWRYGAPPPGNANFAWVQHMAHHLAPGGRAGFVLANGSMSTQQSGEGDIRRALIEAGLVDCMVALPGQLFYSTPIPACLWFLARDRERAGETLFIDARALGRMVDRTHRELTAGDIARVAGAFHAWRDGDGGYADEPGFCRAATLDDIRAHGHVLTPGRYVGAVARDDEDEPIAEALARLGAEWRGQRAEAARLDEAIAQSLDRLGGAAGGA